MGGGRRGRLVVSVALVACVGWACARGRIYLESVDVPGDAPTNDKIEIARAIATQAGHDRLTAEARKRFPAITERQLNAIVLSWRVYPASGDERERVAIIVGYRPVEPGFDPRPIVDYCKEVLARQLAADP